MNSMMGYTGPTGAFSGDKIPSGYRMGQINQFTPQQHRLFKQMFGQVSPDSYLSRLAGGDQSMFEEMEAPAFRQFNQLQGNLASRFSGMGGGARRSSGFKNMSSAAASNFAQDLASQRQALQRQAIMDLMGISQSLLGQRPYEKFLVEKQQKQPSGFGSLIGAGVGGLGGFLAGGPVGAMQGAQFGYGLGSAF